jgi:RNA ligase
VSLIYPKTENLFTRDPETHKLNMGDLRVAEFGLIKHWHVTEKIDGTNMRVVYDPKAETVEIRGRSDAANIPGDLLKTMQDMFPLENLQRQFDGYLAEQIELGTTVTIYGEGYGAGIQKGGYYNPNKAFRVFDVCYHRYTGLDSWCQPSTVKWICETLQVPMVPVIYDKYTIDDIVDLVQSMKNGNTVSNTAFRDSEQTAEPEGIIARTDPYLYNEHGGRIMFKLKTKDLP